METIQSFIEFALPDEKLSLLWEAYPCIGPNSKIGPDDLVHFQNHVKLLTICEETETLHEMRLEPVDIIEAVGQRVTEWVSRHLNC